MATAGPMHWRVGVLAVLAALLAAVLQGLVRGAFVAALLAVGGAGLWLAAVGDIRVDSVSQGLVAVAVLAWVLRASPLPRMVPWGVLLIGIVEGVRMGIVAQETLPAALPLAMPLVVAGAIIALQTAAVPASRWASLALGASGAWILGTAVDAAIQPPVTPDEVREYVARGVEDSHFDAIATSPDLARAGLEERPRWHELGRRVADEAGLESALDSGWDPLGAGLGPPELVVAAHWLEAHGHGGRGRRLLFRNRHHSSVTWYLVLFSRLEGIEDPVSITEVPEGLHRLPGLARLDWDFYANQSRSMVFHANEPLAELVFELWAESYFGNPRLLVEVDGRGLTRLEVPEGRQRMGLGVTLLPGPHRLRVSYDNDLENEAGDRNVGLISVSAR